MNIKITVTFKNRQEEYKFEHITADIVDAYKHIEAVVRSPLYNYGTDESKTAFLEEMMHILVGMRFENKISFENWMLRVERMEEDPDEKQ